MNRNIEEEFQFPHLTEEELLDYKSEERESDLQRRKFMKDRMDRGQTFHFILGAVAAGLVIAGIYLVVYFLFLLFAVKIGLG